MTTPAGEQFGPYIVYEQIGMGGMATVHRAETTGLAGFRKPVALKRMLPSIASNEEFVRSFVREARLASHLRHSNVAQTYDLGKVGDVYFIAMELVIGRTLRDMLRHAFEARIRIPIPIALHILNQICDALDYAHNLCNEAGAPLGIIHRDVSPSNVIVSDAGIVKLIDFGIAKASSSSLQVQTMTGVIKGKFSYIAPEYIAGQIDARADLFAVGIVAYELLTGNPLFKGKDDMDTLNRVQTMQIPPPSKINPDIPPAIDAVVMTALRRDPDVRWQRASAMRIALTTELSRLGITTSDRQLAQWVQATSTTPIPAREEIDSQPPTKILRVNTGTTLNRRALDSAPSIVVEFVSEPAALPAAQQAQPPTAELTAPDSAPAFVAPWTGGATPSSTSSPIAVPAPTAAEPSGPTAAEPSSPSPGAAAEPSQASASTATELSESSATTAKLPAQPFASAIEPAPLPAAPEISRASKHVTGRRTKPRFGRTLAPPPPSGGAVSTRGANHHDKWAIVLWILLAAAATVAVIHFALPFLL